MAIRKKVLHLRSNQTEDNKAKLPNPNSMEYGEIAVNYSAGNETLSIKNSNNEIASFTNKLEKFYDGYNEVTDLENIPVDKHLVIAELDDYESYHLTYDEELPAGYEQHIIIPATKGVKGFTLPENTIGFNDEPAVIITPGNDCNVNITSTGSNLYVNLNTVKSAGVWGTKVDREDVIAGDICMYNDDTCEIIFIRPSYDTNSQFYGMENYNYLVGVAVIPASHDVYGDGSIAVMSYNDMDYNNPEQGTAVGEHQYIRWGNHNIDITELTKFGRVTYVGKGTNINNSIQGVTYYAYLPSDKFTALNNPYDNVTKYYSNSTSYYQAPSPYAADGSRNPLYYQTASPSTAANALSDFDGVGNTEIIVSKATAEDWENLDKLTNSSGEGYYPAACCCRRYRNEGLDMLGNDYQYYMPACGELGYIMPRFNKIQNALTAIQRDYRVGSPLLGNLRYYWSSSQGSAAGAMGVGTNNGHVDSCHKSDNHCVRAFVRV